MLARMLSHRPMAVREATHERLVRLRLARGWTQREVAEMAGLSVQTVSRAENGGDIYAYVLERLAELYGQCMCGLWSGKPCPS